MNCKVEIVPVNASIFATRLMFLPVIMDRFLHIAFPLSYKRMFTTRRIAVIISSLWLLSLLLGLSSLADQDYTPMASAEGGVCF